MGTQAIREGARDSASIRVPARLATATFYELMALAPPVRREFLNGMDRLDAANVFAAAFSETGSRFGMYVDDPVGFYEQVIGESLWSLQAEVLAALVAEDVKTVIVPAGFGLGKTHVAGGAVCWHVSVHPVGVAGAVTTATRFRQVQKQLWPHVRRMHAKAGLLGDCDMTQWQMPNADGVATPVAYGFCYDDDTEILTRDGWLPFQKLTGAEDVATRSPAGQFEWQRPTRIVDDPYDGPMLRFKSQVYDLLVTPNHRMLVRRDPKQLRAGDNSNTDWHIREARWFVDHAAHQFQIPATSTWEAPAPEPVTFGPHTIDPDAFARFLGLYLAEGFTSTGADHPNRVTVCQSATSPRLPEVRAILDATGLPWGWSPGKGVSGKFYMNCAPLARWLLSEAYIGSIARSWTKRIPKAIKEWPAAHLTALIEGAMVGDGHTEAWGYRRYLTTSEQYADDLIEVAQKAGGEAWIDAHDAHPTTWGKRRQYRVNFRPGAAHQVPKPTVEHHTGRIGCVSVPNGIVYVRRNGRPAWCGNTAPEKDESAMQGIHFPKTLLIVDEAGGIGRTIGQATRNLMTGDARMLAIGNPPTDNEASWFEGEYEKGRDPARTHIVSIPIPATRSPAVTGEWILCQACPSVLAAHSLGEHLVDQAWIDEAIEEHGAGAPYVEAKVNAVFPKGGASRAIPAAYVDAALEAMALGEWWDDDYKVARPVSFDSDGRPYEVQPPIGAEIDLGVDVAADGGDEFVITRREGDIVRIRYVAAGAGLDNSVTVAGLVLDEIRVAEALAVELGTERAVHVKVDVIGLGWGVASTLEAWAKELVHTAVIVRVDVREVPDNPDDPKAVWRPARKRDEMWLAGRDAFKPDRGSGRPRIRLDVDHRAAAQLRTPLYDTNTAGRHVIESKKDVRARLGRDAGGGAKSPDRADAILLALYTPRVRRKTRILA